ARGAGRGRQLRAGRTRHHQRIARYTNARAERRANACHGVLGVQPRARLCGRRALCPDHGVVLPAAHLVAVHVFEAGCEPMSLLELEGIRRRYGSVTALDGVDLSVPADSCTAVVGPSGSGKTTLLRIIAGFDAAEAGKA